MTDRELMQMVLDALSNFDKGNHGMRWQVPLVKALRARLAQPEPAECDGGQCGIGGYCKQCPKTQPKQEPVAWISCNAGLYHGKPDESLKPLPLYTASPQHEWVGLTHEEHMEILTRDLTAPSRIAVAEAKLKEKNT